LLRADLVIVDELGFGPLDLAGTQLLFRFVTNAASASPATGPSTPESRGTSLMTGVVLGTSASR